MSSNRLGNKIHDDRDVANTDKINETVRYYGEWVYNKLKNILGEVYPLVVRPVSNGAAGFFKGEDGNYRVMQPVANAAMIPGNAAMVLADGFLPLHPNGGFGVPTAPIFGRMYQLLQLAGEIGNSRLPWADRIKCPVAAVTAATLAVYVGLQAMSVTNSVLNNQFNFAADLTLDPYKIVATLMQGDSTMYHKMLVGLAGYIGATNALVKGKELVLHEVQDWWDQLWADVQKDQLVRHLQKLEGIHGDAEQVKRLEADYHRAVEQGKDWTFVDLTGRSLERAMLIPSAIFSFPSHNTRHVTVPKAWLQKNGYVKSGVDYLRFGGDWVSQRTHVSIKNSATAVVNLLGWDTQGQAVKPDHYPTHDLMMNERMKEYWILPAPLNSVASLFNDDKRTERQRKLDIDLIQQYTRNIFNFKLHLPLSAPLMTYGRPFLPGDAEWQNKAAANEHVQKMLRGEFPDAAAPLREKARLFNEALYSVYVTGEYKPNNHLKMNVD